MADMTEYCTFKPFAGSVQLLVEPHRKTTGLLHHVFLQGTARPSHTAILATYIQRLRWVEVQPVRHRVSGFVRSPLISPRHAEFRLSPQT